MNVKYNQYLNSPDWKAKRQAKYSSFKKKGKNPRCCICASEERLEVHHLIYEKDLTQNKQDSLRLLCRICHQTTHDLINDGTLVYKNRNVMSRYVLTKTAVKKRLGLGQTNCFTTR